VTRGPTQGLAPADLRDGHYVQPFAALKVEQLWCGRREVWTATHGWAGRYHVMIDGGVAACRSKQEGWRNRSVIVIGEDTLVQIDKVPPHMRCRRGGCRQIFDAFLTRSTEIRPDPPDRIRSAHRHETGRRE
jgi:hypothetical protein